MIIPDDYRYVTFNLNSYIFAVFESEWLRKLPPGSIIADTKNNAKIRDLTGFPQTRTQLMHLVIYKKVQLRIDTKME